MEKEPIKLIAVLNKVSSTKDGGSRIVLDCGSDSLSAIHRIQQLNAEGDICLAIVVVPFEKDSFE